MAGPRRAAFSEMAACALLLLTTSAALPRAAVAFHRAPEPRDAVDARHDFDFRSSISASDQQQQQANSGFASPTDNGFATPLSIESTYSESSPYSVPSASSASVSSASSAASGSRDPAALIAASAGLAYPMRAPIYVAKSQLPVMMSLKATWSKYTDLSSWDGAKPCAQWFRIKCWTDGTIRRMEMSGLGLGGGLPSNHRRPHHPARTPLYQELADACAP
ncbi:hypothetical protein CLOP_g7645 [Closterium sp. NIES-67]|nr:hypothetical protein CLOP_g7645 [Closterium sp. NIES-67]